jgi:hypothetical protein
MTKSTPESFLHWFWQNYNQKNKKRKFTQKEKDLLRPIAEVCAIMDGNAFFGMTRNDQGEDTWYEQYLPEAWAIYKAQGKNGGWINQTSWAMDSQHENTAVKDAYEQWRLLKLLSRKTI